MASKPNGRIDEESQQPSGGAVRTEPEDVYRDDDSAGDGIPIVDPPTGEAAQREPEPSRRRRGRPRGATSASSNAKQAKAATDLTAILMSAHMMLAHIAKVQELELDVKEAKALSEAVNRVQELYEMPILTEKQLAWINLGMVGLSTYGTRYVAFTMRKKKEKGTQPPTINADDFKVQ
jgi:hypothetical protein